jgi:hypothetical protein
LRIDGDYRLPLRQFIGGEGRGEVALQFMGRLEEHDPNGAPASQPAFNAYEPQV